MDLSFLNDYIVVVIVGICGCVGYVLKRLDFIPNKFIPLILLCLGTLINVLTNLPEFKAGIVLGGMASGLASTGTYEAMRNFVGKDGGNKDNTSQNDGNNTKN